MTRRDDMPTAGEMLGEILDLVTGLGVMLLPALLLAIPGLILLLPLALLALPLVLLAAPLVLIHYLRRWLAGRERDTSERADRQVRSRVTPTAAR
jgi:hypothetical protein